MKKKLLFAIPVLLLLSVFIIDKQPQMNEFSYFNPEAFIQGQLKYDLNLDNAITKFSSHIVIGSPERIEDINENYAAVYVKVKDSLMGDLSETVIKVRAHKKLLDLNKEYIMFLKEFDSALLTEGFYNLFNSYVMEIDDSESIALIQNPVDKKLMKPFVEEKYNKVSYIKEHIAKVKNKNIFKDKKSEKIIESASDMKEMIVVSDHIIEITVKNLELMKSSNDNSTFASAGFEINKTYKGGNFENVYRLLLPNVVENEGIYLVFLKDTYDGGLTPTARKGSVISVNDTEYTKAVKVISKD